MLAAERPLHQGVHDEDDRDEGEEDADRERLKTKWAALEALVGSPERVALVAKDLVEHFENRQQAMDGKAMVVVMSRRIAVELYQAIVDLRPDWHDEEDDKGNSIDIDAPTRPPASLAGHDNDDKPSPAQSRQYRLRPFLVWSGLS